MQSEALANKAADAVGVTPYSDMRPFVEQAVKWALNEAALSTDAEPVGYLFQMFYPGSETWSGDMFSDQKPTKNLPAEHMRNVRALYDRPQQPAPAVAVKALLDDVWNTAVEKAAAIADDCVHLTPDPGAAIKTMLNGRAKLHPSSDAALSAQVQDVAETEDDIVERMVKSLRDPFPSELLMRSGGIDYWRDIMRNAYRAASPASKHGDAE